MWIMKKPKRPQKQTPDKLQERDFFQTPDYAVDLLIPYMPINIQTIWECATGSGKIANRLRQYGYNTIETDITTGTNFLAAASQGDAIVTNPPYSLKIKFYERCREHGLPFALLVPTDLAQWNLDAVKDGAQWLIPTRRIDYITPRGLRGKDSQAQFHSGWLTWGFDLPDTLTVVELTLETKKNPSLI